MVRKIEEEKIECIWIIWWKCIKQRIRN